MGFIDAHVHVWTDDYNVYPFSKGYDPEQAVPRTILPDEILEHARPCGVDRVVLVQMSYYKDDNRYMLKVMEDYPGVFAGIGVVDWDGEDPAAHMRQLAASGVRGFRVFPRNVEVTSWCHGEGLGRMFATAADEGLAICPLIDPNALPALARRCAEFPATRVIIDHICCIGADGEIRDDDVRALCDMAHFDQVMVKLSAFYALGRKASPYTDLSELIERVVGAFGPDRCMWASDAPYQLLNEHSYAASIALIREGLDFLGDADRQQLLQGTAESVFFRS